jgi:hypothetical protein
MATTPTPEEAIDRARRVLDDRIDTIRQAVEARQHVTDVRDETDRERAELEARIAQRVGDAERADVKAYNAAVSAGWSAEELRKIGLPEPDKKARARRRTSRRSTTSRTSQAAQRSSADDGSAGTSQDESSGA